MEGEDGERRGANYEDSWEEHTLFTGLICLVFHSLRLASPAHENQNKMKTTKREDIIDNVGQGGKENGKLKGKLKMKRRGLEATSERNPLRNNYSDPSRVLL